ncbi:hypothetical protein HYDPIDRAFT_170839 [Hydnomerulius pinastri MD-312]|uniref:Uncharacterized protein n=1 Tax=Hydnomerulius pinastri MD-312 TaxID=994086 RepID=A0A0C9W8L6_9AGAM|nr:hypothetical protein HYDPIDRAFT_170839 [Hydnomerulius pinastri MD-312]
MSSDYSPPVEGVLPACSQKAASSHSKKDALPSKDASPHKRFRKVPKVDTTVIVAGSRHRGPSAQWVVSGKWLRPEIPELAHEGSMSLMLLALLIASRSDAASAVPDTGNIPFLEGDSASEGEESLPDGENRDQCLPTTAVTTMQKVWDLKGFLFIVRK